jgi:recombinational DNA repair protein RecR
MLLCRQMDERDRIVDRCRDAASDARGFMVVLEDQDVISMLEMVADGRRGAIDQFLQRRFDEINH